MSDSRTLIQTLTSFSSCRISRPSRANSRLQKNSVMPRTSWSRRGSSCASFSFRLRILNWTLPECMNKFSSQSNYEPVTLQCLREQVFREPEGVELRSRSLLIDKVVLKDGISMCYLEFPHSDIISKRRDRRQKFHAESAFSQRKTNEIRAIWRVYHFCYRVRIQQPVAILFRRLQHSSYFNFGKLSYSTLTISVPQSRRQRWISFSSAGGAVRQWVPSQPSPFPFPFLPPPR